MTSYNFTTNWNPKINLEIFTKLGSDKIFNPNSHLKWIRDLHADHKNNIVQFRIDAAKNDNDIPETTQLNAIEFIINNEAAIYNQIYNHLKNIIYPYYSDLFEEDLQNDFPLDGIESMPDVLGLVEIQVNQMSRNNLAWCTYIFEWEGEQEHGLSMLFEGSKFLKHDSAGDMWFDKVVPDQELELLRIGWNKQMPKKLYYPNVQLKSYKPWQLELTKDFLIDMLKEDKLAEFKEIVSDVAFNVNQKFPEDGHPLIEYVVEKGFFEAGKFIYELGANPKGIMHFGNPYYENSFRIEFAKMINWNIDEKNDAGETLLEQYLKIAKREFGFNNIKSMDLYEKHIKLLLKYGAELNDSENYQKVLNYMNISKSGN